MNQESKEKLNKYEFDDEVIYTGFSNYNDAENFSIAENGTLSEVAFRNGNDNPEMTSEANLLADKNHFAAFAGEEYRFIHSGDPQFKDYAANLMEKKSDLDNEDIQEKYFAPGKTQLEEDPVIVLKNGELESVTSIERAKYLKHANVYQIGVVIKK
ncbi:hypothetical protein [Halpernia frigidisoli]|nr:hypothetical protein [Halpernia frigidisoli]